MKRSFKRFVERLESIGINDELADRVSEKHVTLSQLYDDKIKSRSIVAARRDVYKWLVSTKEMSGYEVARLFDRSRSGVWHLLKEES